MRKKMLAITLSLSLMAGMFSACGKKETKTDDNAKQSEEVTPEASVTEAAPDKDKTSDENDGLAELIAQAKSASIATVNYTPVLPTAKEDAEIFIEPIEGISDDFIRGVDISSVISEEESGVVYKDWDGNEKDIFQILADAGVNYIRVRIWNDPYDDAGNGYGGGNCDVDKAVTIGKRAAECGMKLLLDFHYSDFWADPSKQQAPKEWTRNTLNQKTKDINAFTQEAIAKVIAGGADVGMVQIGNEINKGVCGVYETEGAMQLLASASEGVRTVAKETGRDIKVIIHYTQLDDPVGMMNRVKTLDEYNIDYDIFGVSYYVYWHGTMENMNQVLKDIKAQYGVDTCIMETAYPYTALDGDSNGNNVSADEAIEGYPATVQGQAKIVRDVMYYANDAGALGVFYWEPAWTPVGTDRESNEVIWEKYGSGWASSYAAKYDPKDAGEYYGGCSWDNQAMFDFDSKAMASLNVFKWIKYGTNAPLQVMSYEKLVIESSLGAKIELPDTIQPFYNDPSVTDKLKISWSESDIAKINVNVGDTYTVSGTVENGDTVTATVKVMNVNLLKNGTFDEADASVWTVDDKGAGDATDIQKKAADATSGENSLHFYSLEGIEFDAYQTVTVEKDGLYAAAANLQGGDVGDSAEIYLFVKAGGNEYKSDPVVLSGWTNWQKAKVSDVELKAGDEVTVGIHVKAAAKGWGTIDDVEFYVMPVLSDDAGTEDNGGNSESGNNTANEAGDTFTFYYYYEGTDTLVMDIWKHTALEFTGNATVADPFGWNKDIATLTPVDGKPNWYSTEIKILNASATEDGFTIYEKSNSSSGIFQGDSVWSDDNGKNAWAAMISGEKGAYAIKEWTLTDIP